MRDWCTADDLCPFSLRLTPAHIKALSSSSRPSSRSSSESGSRCSTCRTRANVDDEFSFRLWACDEYHEVGVVGSTPAFRLSDANPGGDEKTSVTSMELPFSSR